MRSPSSRNLRIPSPIQALIVGLSACATQACGQPALMPAANQTVPLRKALEGIERSLQQAGFAALSDASLGVGRKEAIREEVERAQCRSGAANPLMVVLTGAATLSLQASVSIASQGAVTLGVAPSVTVGGTVTAGDQRQVTIPVTLVSAGSLSDFYLGQMLASLTNVSALAEEDRRSMVHPAVQRIFETCDALREVVNAQIGAYPPSAEQCRGLGVEGPAIRDAARAGT